ncbi:hypothetical protein F66182_3900 [Fusarium sp. NRRL 66182]|nr:hypothetical protein F66182_3900 [Fusarium sp. NRRL 66182]
MSLLRRTAHSLSTHARPHLPVTFAATRRAIGISHPATTRPQSPCANRRSFHVTSAVDETITATADAFGWIHATGMPWYLTIPLVAFGVNATFRFPLQLYNAYIREERNRLKPLIIAWTSRHSRHPTIANPSLPEHIRRFRHAGAIEKSTRRIYKQFGVQRWKSMAPLLGIVPFITISEALRRKCGAPIGLIGNSFGLGSSGSATAGVGAAGSIFDESMVDGGCLWFTDLSSMDPYYGLPLICTSILILGSWVKMPKELLRAYLLPPGKGVLPLSRLQKLLGRIMLLMPIFPLLVSQLPSAIFLYWATSFGLTRANDFIIDRLALGKASNLKVPSLKAPPRTSNRLSIMRAR